MLPRRPHPPAPGAGGEVCGEPDLASAGPPAHGLSVAPPAPHAAALAHLRAADERMAALIARAGPCGLALHDPETVHAQHHFEGLVSAIVSQQLSSKAAD